MTNVSNSLSQGNMRKQQRQITLSHTQEERWVAVCLGDYRHVGCSHFKSVRRVPYADIRQEGVPANMGYAKPDRKLTVTQQQASQVRMGMTIKSKVLMGISESMSFVATARWYISQL